MKGAQDFSDEQLNAFVDRQLGPQECDDILAAIATDAELGQRLCALRATKELVRHAYDKVPAARRASNHRLPVWGGALAASLVLMLGMLAGWVAHDAATTGETPRPIAALAGGLFAPEPARILIHLDSSRAEQMEATLDLAEAYLAKTGSAQVEVIANHRGLELLRVDTTPHAARIARLKVRHAQVGFVACGQTISRLQGAGVVVALLPEAAVASTAIEHVAERVQQGWTYLKI
jgi:intracellular sulfur oxidation DsrE/DsrF family protein